MNCEKTGEKQTLFAVTLFPPTGLYKNVTFYKWYEENFQIKVAPDLPWALIYLWFWAFFTFSPLISNVVLTITHGQIFLRWIRNESLVRHENTRCKIFIFYNITAKNYSIDSQTNIYILCVGYFLKRKNYKVC